MKETLERELKLGVTPGFKLPELPGEALGLRVFTSTYYDTAEHRLAGAGVTLRRRVEDRQGLWQLKLPRGLARLEIEHPGGPGGPPAELRDLVMAYSRGGQLLPLATLRSRRAGIRVRGLDGPVADVVMDTVALLDGRRVVRRLHEIEVELSGGDEKDLARIDRALRAAGAVDGDARPKLFQALGLELPPAPRPLPRSAPAVEHLKAVVQGQLAEMLAHDPGARLGTDPEALHQMRVAVRRLRALLRAARSMLEHEWSESLRADLHWLGGVLGRVRDLDVLLDHLRGELGSLDAADGRAFGRLLGLLVADRSAARAAMLDALRSERYLRVLDHIEDAARQPKVVAADISLDAIAAEEFRKLRRAMRALSDPPSDEELHGARIKGKRARYAAELAEAVMGKPASRFIRKAKVFQDVLGEHQDAVAAEARIRQLLDRAKGARSGFAAGRLVERQHARRLAARAGLDQAWTKLERRGRKAWA